jgi:folate-binding protein YgfZ
MPVAGIFGVNDPDIRPIAGETVPLDDQPHWLDGGNLVIRTIGDPDRAWLIGPAAGSNDLKSIDDSAWVLGSIRAGLPFIVAATQELFVPQMLNLDRLGAISFDKGCYVGQEIIARTQNLGRIKRRMYGFRSDQATSLDPGMTIYGPDSATGKVVLAADNELLAVVPIDQSAGDWFADEERMLPLKPTPLPCDETGRSKQ